MTVGAIQSGAWEQPLQPAEQGLVADVHPQRDLGIAPVATEVTLADQHSHDEPSLGVGELGLLALGHDDNCFTVQKNVKRAWPVACPGSDPKVVSPYRKT